MLNTPSPRALVGVSFFPRGGSAHVIRGLANAMPDHGWEVTLLAGSRAGHGDAARFYAPLEVHAVELGDDEASYEDRPDVPDRVFAALDDDAFERQVAHWSRALEEAGAADADVLHLHHLTPLHEAAARVAPEVPVVGHLHGTELLMLERIAEGAPESWAHAARWAERMRGWADRCARTIVLTERQIPRVRELLGDAVADRCVAIPNGVDAERFAPREIDRRAHWHRHLVEQPRGWRPGGEEGSIAYGEGDLAAFEGDGPVLLYVGRFTAVKRIGLLIRAFARAQRRFDRRVPLVLIGGHPGEWEGEHPLEAIAAAGARDVFLAGWRDHDELPRFLVAGDALVLPSVREQFGSVLVEAMACGLPAVAVDALGPGEIVRDGESGWLVAPDDEEGLAEALVEVVADGPERRRRGQNARADMLARYSRDAAAARVAATYTAACRTRTTPSGAPAVAPT